MKIYISSSFRNLHAVQSLAALLREQGHDILDWTRQAPPIPSGTPPHERRALLDSDDTKQAFTFCAESAASADLFIYLGPSGQDSGVELGIAHAAGVYVIGLPGPFEQSGTMLSGCVNLWAHSVDHILQLADAACMTDGGFCFDLQ